uniref:Uncharacterized protein n=1 Tax=Ixodes ricinus TaxID=34613 RepID=A0A6B0UWW9_IXORI
MRFDCIPDLYTNFFLKTAVYGGHRSKLGELVMHSYEEGNSTKCTEDKERGTHRPSADRQPVYFWKTLFVCVFMSVGGFPEINQLPASARSARSSLSALHTLGAVSLFVYGGATYRTYSHNESTRIMNAPPITGTQCNLVTTGLVTRDIWI